LATFAWLLCFGAYILPWLRSMDRLAAQRVIATLHSFRFFGLVFILPGVVSPDLPPGFATFSAYGDFATGVLAMLALVTIRIRPLFWAVRRRLQCRGDGRPRRRLLPRDPGRPSRPTRACSAPPYAIPIIYVPLLMITHITAFYWLVRPQQRTPRAIAGDATAS